MTQRLLLFVLTLTLISCTQGERSESQRLQVVASITPYASLVRLLGGESIEVRTMVPPGANLHTFDLSPAELRETEHAVLLVFNGAQLEFWADKVRSSTSAKEVVFTEGLVLLESTEHQHAGVTGSNPHVWLLPSLLISGVFRVQEALSTIDSSLVPMFRRNAEALVDSLRRLEDDIRNEVSTWRQKSFIAYHATWDYFAAGVGLTQAAVVERHPGIEISPRELSGIMKLMRERDIRVIFGEVQSSRKAIDALASETGARVVMLDPIGATVPQGDYFAMMRLNLARMAEAMR